jgi:hypothetical protein
VRIASVTSFSRIGAGSGAAVLRQHVLGPLAVQAEHLHLIGADGVVQGIGGRHRADQDEHDQPHPLLPVIGAVEEADAGAGQNEERADPRGRWRRALGRAVELREGQDDLGAEQQQRREGEADQRRERQGAEDVGRLAPIDPAGAVGAAH